MLVVADGDVEVATVAPAAADEWQLVSRGSSRKKKHSKQQRHGVRNGAAVASSHHASVEVAKSSSSAVTTASGYKYKAHSSRDRRRHGSIDTPSDGSVPLAKQSAIQGRIARIALALRDSKLLLDAVRVIDAHFQLKQSSAGTPAPRDQVVHLVSYGLGSFCSSTNAIYQLAYANALLDALRERIDTASSVAEIFDPVMNKSDIAIAEHFGFATIQQNECGKRAASAKTVFFMPHCGKTLYQNVLASNWGQQQLSDVVLIGNSFEAYSDRLISATERRASVLVGVLPFLSETPLAPGLSKSHDEFTYYEAAFNDLSIHVFPVARAHEALLNTELARQMAQIVDAEQSTSRQDDEELIIA